VLGTFIYEGVKLKGGRGDVFNQSLIYIHTPLSPSSTPIFYLPFFNSFAQEIVLRKESIGGACPSSPQ
jgi:hypothetical protein